MKKKLVILNPRDANGPDGYPRYDSEHPFWIAAKKIVEDRKADAERAKNFQKKLAESFK